MQSTCVSNSKNDLHGAQPLPGATESLTHCPNQIVRVPRLPPRSDNSLGCWRSFQSQLEEGDRSAASLSVVVEGCVQRKVVLNGEGIIQDRVLKPFQSLRRGVFDVDCDDFDQQP